MSSKSGNTTVSCRATLPVCYGNLFQHISTSTRHGMTQPMANCYTVPPLTNHGAATCHVPMCCESIRIFPAFSPFANLKYASIILGFGTMQHGLSNLLWPHDNDSKTWSKPDLFIFSFLMAIDGIRYPGIPPLRNPQKIGEFRTNSGWFSLWLIPRFSQPQAPDKVCHQRWEEFVYHDSCDATCFPHETTCPTCYPKIHPKICMCIHILCYYMLLSYMSAEFWVAVLFHAFLMAHGPLKAKHG